MAVSNSHRLTMAPDESHYHLEDVCQAVQKLEIEPIQDIVMQKLEMSSLSSLVESGVLECVLDL
jgi:hypothetical protein